MNWGDWDSTDLDASETEDGASEGGDAYKYGEESLQPERGGVRLLMKHQMQDHELDASRNDPTA